MDFLQTVGAIAAVCGCITAVGAVVLLIVAVVKKAKAPNDKQNERLAGHDNRLSALEKIVNRHDELFENDLRRFNRIEAGNRIVQRSILALLSHSIDGNDVESLRKAKQELQNYLIEQ